MGKSKDGGDNAETQQRREGLKAGLICRSAPAIQSAGRGRQQMEGHDCPQLTFLIICGNRDVKYISPDTQPTAYPMMPIRLWAVA